MTIATSATGSPSVAAPPSVARATRPHLASHLGAIAQLAAAGLVGSLLFGALATLLSLVVVPCVYTVLDDVGRISGRIWRRLAPNHPQPAE